MENSSRISGRKRPDSFVRCLHAIVASAVLGCSVCNAQSSDFDLGGHTKYRLTHTTFPDDSLLRDLAGSDARDLGFDARLNLSWGSGNWDVRADAQVAVLHGDAIDFTRNFGEDLQALFPRLPSDERRLFDLTHIVSDEGKPQSAAAESALAPCARRRQAESTR